MNDKYILDADQMIDYINTFTHDMTQQITIGGIVGSNICRLVVDTICDRDNIKNVCIVEGCQDMTGFDILPNHVFYGDIFYDCLCDSPDSYKYDEFKPKMFQPKPYHAICIDTRYINQFDAMIINDAHLIPDQYLLSIYSNFCGKKLISIVDPLDVNGDKYSNIFTIIHSVDKAMPLSPMIALARELCDVDTYNINKKMKNDMIKRVAMSKRSIGKIDENQYITKSKYLCNIIRDKQYQSKLHKNQKFIIDSDAVNRRRDTNGRIVSLPRNSMLYLQTLTRTSWYSKYRIFSTKSMINDIDISYTKENDNSILVKPANIILFDEAIHHRYKNAVIVFCEDDEDTLLTTREEYSLLKNSLNITIGCVSNIEK